MYTPGTRIGFTQVYPVVTRKLSTYGKTATNLLARKAEVTYSKPERRTGQEASMRKLSPFKDIYRSASAGFATAATSNQTSDDDYANFMSAYPGVLRDLTQNEYLGDVPEVVERFTQTLKYNVWPGKKNCALMHLAAYKAFADPEQLTEENMKKAYILAWCCQLGVTSLIMTDDMMDDCEMRRGTLCWYRKKEIGVTAVNDALMVECAGLLLLRRHFIDHPRYSSFVDEYQNIFLKTAIGQCLDVLCMQNGKPQLHLFTKARFDAVVKHKALSGVYGPVALATLLAGVDAETHAKTKSLMLQIGRLFQAQDDFLDYFGTPEVTGKDNGNDIKDGKCTWLAVTALERATPEQRVIMERCYGSPDPKHIQAIRDLYTDMNIPQLFSVYEDEFYTRLRKQINEDFSKKPQDMFHNELDKLYRRRH